MIQACYRTSTYMRNIKSIEIMQVNVSAAHNWKTYNEKMFSLHAPAKICRIAVALFYFQKYTF